MIPSIDLDAVINLLATADRLLSFSREGVGEEALHLVFIDSATGRGPTLYNALLSLAEDLEDEVRKEPGDRELAVQLRALLRGEGQ